MGFRDSCGKIKLDVLKRVEVGSVFIKSRLYFQLYYILEKWFIQKNIVSSIIKRKERI